MIKLVFTVHQKSIRISFDEFVYESHEDKKLIMRHLQLIDSMTCTFTVIIGLIDSSKTVNVCVFQFS